jgi:hypothetical protein
VQFDKKIIEARLSLNLIGSSDMPKLAWDALEAGFDGPAIRRLAALDSPTHFEVRDVLPRAMQEIGIVTVSKDEASLRIAKDRAKEILERHQDPLKCVREFWHLWIKSGYSRVLTPVGTLNDDVYWAQGVESEETIRLMVTQRLKELIRARMVK